MRPRRRFVDVAQPPLEESLRRPAVRCGTATRCTESTSCTQGRRREWVTSREAPDDLPRLPRPPEVHPPPRRLLHRPPPPPHGARRPPRGPLRLPRPRRKEGLSTLHTEGDLAAEPALAPETCE